jgi:murein DD-endopeptidase MepM/ murein hydrolase activator NlpD
MSKYKYIYDPENVCYKKHKHTAKHRILKFFTYLSILVIAAIATNIVFSIFFDTPKEKGLKRENERMVEHYNELNSRFDEITDVLENIQERDRNIYRTIFEASPIPKSIWDAGYGGVNRYKELEKQNNSEIVIDCYKRIEKIENRVNIQTNSLYVINTMAEEKSDFLACIPAIQPISNKNLKRTASGYGWRIHPIYKIKKFHYGIDFTAPRGTKIYAAGDGKVVEISRSSRVGYGRKIVVDHGFGYKTLYAHLEGFNVKRGQQVKRGEVIGFVGNTGLSVAPHLHYEVIKNGKKVNPVHYFFKDLSPKEYEEMIIIASRSGQSFD